MLSSCCFTEKEVKKEEEMEEEVERRVLIVGLHIRQYQQIFNLRSSLIRETIKSS